MAVRRRSLARRWSRGQLGLPSLPVVLDAPIERQVRRGGWVVEVGEDGAVDLAGHVAFQAADDLALGQSLGGAAGEVGLGPRVVVHADQDDAPQRVVGLAVAAAIEPVPAGAA